MGHGWARLHRKRTARYRLPHALQLETVSPPFKTADGCEVVGKLIPSAHTVFFESCNHWLYLEDPAKFNQVRGVAGSPGASGVLGGAWVRPGCGTPFCT